MGPDATQAAYEDAAPLFIERQRTDPMLLPLLHEKSLDRAWQRQLTQRMPHRRLPDRHRTEQHIIGRVHKQRSCPGREFVRTRDDPQERAGIEQTLHPRELSKA